MPLVLLAGPIVRQFHPKSFLCEMIPAKAFLEQSKAIDGALVCLLYATEGTAPPGWNTNGGEKASLPATKNPTTMISQPETRSNQ